MLEVDEDIELRESMSKRHEIIGKPHQKSAMGGEQKKKTYILSPHRDEKLTQLPTHQSIFNRKAESHLLKRNSVHENPFHSGSPFRILETNIKNEQAKWFKGDKQQKQQKASGKN